MYETTVSVEQTNSHLLDFVVSKLAPWQQEAKWTSAVVASKGRKYFSVAGDDVYRYQIQKNVTDAVAQSLSLGYKNIFVRKLLDVDYDDFFQNVLVNTICVFDNEYDRQLVAREIDSGSPIFLDGYYNFRLSSVKKKWQEIANLVAENIYVLTDKQLVLEFLQYLLDSISSKVKCLSINFCDDDFQLFSSANNAIEPCVSLAKKATAQEEAMLNVVCLKPQYIKVYSNGKLSDDFCQMLNALFSCEYVTSK